jgi:5S rRNA maturation endonuclease (ribonuclease M5)
VLVEGLKDRASIRALGIGGDIVMTSQEPLFNLAERVSMQSADIIVLTDWDDRGEEVARNAETYLKSNGSRPDLEPRKKLRILTKKEVKDIEGLHGYIERLRLACAVKPQHY